VTTYAHRHARVRLQQGFTLDNVVAEYRALRACVIRLMRQSGQDPTLDEVVRFNDAVDQALAESIAWYGSAVEHGRELFLAVFGHDLRDPLGAIQLSAEVILADPSLKDPSAVAARRVVNCGARMSRIIEDLIDFTRTRLGTRLPTTLSRVELRGLIGQKVKELRALHPSHEVRYEASAELWGLWDGGRIAQLTSNLIGNAIQHGAPDKPVTIKAYREADVAVITVHNKGLAIPREIMGNIFEPMKRGAMHDGQRNEKASMGLGLYISREIVDAHGGTLQVVSEDGEGTTFEVRLPMQHAAAS